MTFDLLFEAALFIHQALLLDRLGDGPYEHIFGHRLGDVVVGAGLDDLADLRDVRLENPDAAETPGPSAETVISIDPYRKMA